MSSMNIRKVRRRRKLRVRIIKQKDNSSAILIAGCLGFLVGRFGVKR